MTKLGRTYSKKLETKKCRAKKLIQQSEFFHYPQNYTRGKVKVIGQE